MRGALLRNLSLLSRNRHFSPSLRATTPLLSNVYTNFPRKIDSADNALPLNYFPSRLRFFSSENGTQDPKPNPESESAKEKKAAPVEVEDVGNKDNVNDEDFESDFEDAHSTDEDIEDLCNARDIVIERMKKKDPFFGMNDEKWNEMINEATEKGYLQDTRECEDLLEDMLHFDKLLPDEIKKKLEVKFNEIGDRVEKGEINDEEGYELFKEFEDQMVLECAKLMKDDPPKEKRNLDAPRGEGPILRWQTRVVFLPGGDSWHPKNRKVKLSVTVKELGLTKHQFMRLRELVGKRYCSGKDELTITSERFEFREENRKDCYRTLLALIEEAVKAQMMVQDTRVSDMKERLKANPEFMQRLLSKKKASASDPATAS